MVLLAALAALGLILAALNLVYWFFVVTRGEPRAKAWVERRYEVVLTRGRRGHWKARGSGSKLRLVGIELLQILYFMIAFVIWAAGIGAALALLALIAG
jgi:hypothetical protein